MEALYLGNFSSDQFEKQAHMAPIFASWVGLDPIAALRVEDACASGGVAVREAAMAIASGLYDVVMVAGAEKMTDLPINEGTDALARQRIACLKFLLGLLSPVFMLRWLLLIWISLGLLVRLFLLWRLRIIIMVL